MKARRIVVASRDPAVLDLFRQAVPRETADIVIVDTATGMLLEQFEADYHLGVMDLDVPCGDNAAMVAVVRRLRPKLPLIVLSSDPSIEFGSRIVQEGVAYYDVKPVDPATLRHILEAYLTREMGSQASGKDHHR